MGIDRPWKKNYRRVPPSVLDRLNAISSDAVVIACAKRIPKREIQDGVYGHIGLVWQDDDATFPEVLVPSIDNGRYSKINITGRDEVLKNLPMTTKTYSVETPNYGDWSRGSHDIEFTREVYQRRFIPPRELAIRIERTGEDIVAQAYVFKFTVDEILRRNDPDLDERLLFDINLLQENVGNHGLFPADATTADYLGSLYVNWELLPPGERNKNIARIFQAVGPVSLQARQRITQRYDVLARLGPSQFIQGTNGFRKYFGALFADDLVVFENVEYGNAIYVMFEDWKSLSKKSRTELLAEHSDNVVRIPHTPQWAQRLRRLISKELRSRSAR